MKNWKIKHAIWMAANVIKNLTCSVNSFNSENWINAAFEDATELAAEILKIKQMEDKK